MDSKVEKKRLVPKEGLKVFNPKTKTYLKKEGEVVAMTPYWRRRVADGDFQESAPKEAPKPKAVPLEPKTTKEKDNSKK